MPKAVQGTTDSPVTERGLGTVATNTIKSIYQQSPMYTGEMSPEDVKQQYQDEVLNATINDNAQALEANCHQLILRRRFLVRH